MQNEPRDFCIRFLQRRIASFTPSLNFVQRVQCPHIRREWYSSRKNCENQTRRQNIFMKLIYAQLFPSGHYCCYHWIVIDNWIENVFFVVVHACDHHTRAHVSLHFCHISLRLPECDGMYFKSSIDWPNKICFVFSSFDLTFAVSRFAFRLRRLTTLSC